MGEGEDGMIWENGIETCILSYVNRSPVQVPYMRQGAPRPVHWDDPEGWERGSGLGTHVHLWRIHVDVWQNQYSIVK